MRVEQVDGEEQKQAFEELVSLTYKLQVIANESSQD